MTSLLSSQTASHTLLTRALKAAQFLLIALAVLFSGARVWADEARSAGVNLAADYLAALRQRGWHDVALEYLEGASHDPLATPEFLERLDYERATTLANLARQSVGGAQRQAMLARAAAGFEKFAEEQPESPLQLQALATAGNLSTEQALYLLNQADKLPVAARRQRKQLHDTAREYLNRAQTPLKTLLEQCDSKLESLPKAAQSQKNLLQGNRPIQVGRQQLQAKQAEAKFLLAKLDFEKSRTHAPDSKAHRTTLEAAAGAFAKLYKEYEEKLVGFYGRLYQGRSYQSAGDCEQALKCYWDIVDQPRIANQDFRRLLAKAYRYRAECHLKSNSIDQAIEECQEWLNESRGPELKEPDWLAVSYQLATAYEAQAASAEGSDAQRLRTEARKLYREIAKNPGEFQRDAQANMASASYSTVKRPTPKSFDDAFLAGKQSLEQMNSASLAARLAAENNPESVDSLSAQVKAYRNDASQYFRLALQLVDDQTQSEQIVTARYYLGWLHWEANRLADAAVIGAFLARRYPDSDFAPRAAKLALAAYEKLHSAARQSGDPSKYEAEQLTHIAELLVRQWPDSEEATTGLNLLINMALRSDRLADAEKLLQRLPPSRRVAAELRLGSAFWTRYLKASRSGSQQGAPASAAADDGATMLKQQAGELLGRGYQGLQTQPRATAGLTASEAIGVLYNVQYLLASGSAEDAISVLEDSSFGPLSQIEKQTSVGQSAEFVQKAYLVALRTYFSTEPPQREKAQAMMALLEASVGSQAQAQQKLVRIYVNLGLELQRQISELTAEGRVDKARAVAQSFEDLIARVSQRAGAEDDWVVQNWIAQTSLQLGQGLSGDDADRYYQQAEAAYETLLTRATQDAKFAPSPLALLATKKRLADCLQAQGKYEAAFEQYTSILKQKPNMLELQQAAATALQEWGTVDGSAARIEESIRGTLPQANNKNLVWGWIRLASIADQAKRRALKKGDSDPTQASRAAKYKNLFFLARYHVAQARFAIARLATGDRRTQQFRAARQSLSSMQRLYPDLGGPDWQGAYRQLLEQLEQEQ